MSNENNDGLPPPSIDMRVGMLHGRMDSLERHTEAATGELRARITRFEDVVLTQFTAMNTKLDELKASVERTHGASAFGGRVLSSALGIGMLFVAVLGAAAAYLHIH